MSEQEKIVESSEEAAKIDSPRADENSKSLEGGLDEKKDKPGSGEKLLGPEDLAEMSESIQETSIEEGAPNPDESEPRLASAETSEEIIDKPQTPPNPQKEKLLEKIKAEFQIFDQQKNNTIDIREVGTIMRTLGIYPSLDQLNLWITEMEDEKSSEFVTWDRFSTVTVRILLGKYPMQDDEES